MYKEWPGSSRDLALSKAEYRLEISTAQEGCLSPVCHFHYIIYTYSISVVSVDWQFSPGREEPGMCVRSPSSYLKRGELLSSGADLGQE